MVNFDLVYNQVVVIEVIYSINGAVVMVQVWVGNVGDADYIAVGVVFNDFIEDQVLVGENQKLLGPFGKE